MEASKTWTFRCAVLLETGNLLVRLSEKICGNLKKHLEFVSYSPCQETQTSHILELEELSTFGVSEDYKSLSQKQLRSFSLQLCDYFGQKDIAVKSESAAETQKFQNDGKQIGHPMRVETSPHKLSVDIPSEVNSPGSLSVGKLCWDEEWVLSSGEKTQTSEEFQKRIASRETQNVLLKTSVIVSNRSFFVKLIEKVSQTSNVQLVLETFCAKMASSSTHVFESDVFAKLGFCDDYKTLSEEDLKDFVFELCDQLYSKDTKDEESSDPEGNSVDSVEVQAILSNSPGARVKQIQALRNQYRKRASGSGQSSLEDEAPRPLAPSPPSRPQSRFANRSSRSQLNSAKELKVYAPTAPSQNKEALLPDVRTPESKARTWRASHYKPVSSGPSTPSMNDAIEGVYGFPPVC